MKHWTNIAALSIICLSITVLVLTILQFRRFIDYQRHRDMLNEARDHLFVLAEKSGHHSPCDLFDENTEHFPSAETSAFTSRYKFGDVVAFDCPDYCVIYEGEERVLVAVSTLGNKSTLWKHLNHINKEARLDASIQAITKDEGRSVIALTCDGSIFLTDIQKIGLRTRGKNSSARDP